MTEVKPSPYHVRSQGGSWAILNFESPDGEIVALRPTREDADTIAKFMNELYQKDQAKEANGELEERIP